MTAAMAGLAVATTMGAPRSRNLRWLSAAKKHAHARAADDGSYPCEA